jgi:outer membrane receptor protein involved in Fe transport
MKVFLYLALSLLTICNPMALSAQNDTLVTREIELETVIVTAQQREQQILDVPVAISTVSARLLENTHTTTLEQLAAFVPGLNVTIQTPHRPSLSIRGLTSDEVSPTAQPRVSVYYNNIPTSRASMALAELYDMERVEVLKGPQGTLFGRGSQIGVVHFISKKPVSGFGGYVSAGMGNYAAKELEGAINLPVIDNKLLLRVAGIYSNRDGYITNLSGGDPLNGKNTFGGRFSLAYKPTDKLDFDLMVGYQKDDNPGTAFMSKRYPNAKGESDIFNYEASLDSGKTWFNKRDVLLSSLDVKYRINDYSYLISTTSVTANTANHRWDGDGTYAPAIDMQEKVDASQFTEELRYHFSPNDKLSGFVGAGYWQENVEYKHAFYPNEQYFVHLYAPILAAGIDQAYNMGGTLLNGVNQELAYSNLFTPLSQLPQALQYMLMQGGLTGVPPLSTNHSEEMTSGALNRSADIFADVTYEIIPNLNITAGIRGTYEQLETSTSAEQTGGDAATMGMLAGTYPNVFYVPRTDTTISENYLSLIYRLNLMYRISDDMTAFAGYSRGRRPNVLQFGSTGNPEEMQAEQLHSFEAGFKWSAQQRFWLDAGLFYQRYSNFQTTKWVDGNYLTADAGRATSYGVELTAKAALTDFLELFGNYAYIHARFDDEDSDGNRQEYAGNTFRLTPENSFSIGLYAKTNLSKEIQLLFTPVYAWKSHIWFEDANAMQPADPSLARLEQNAYGLLNANLAVKYAPLKMTLSVFAHNLLGEKYLIGAGNTGMMFGVPTYVPGAPRMMGVKLNWDF